MSVTSLYCQFCQEKKLCDVLDYESLNEYGEATEQCLKYIYIYVQSSSIRHLNNEMFSLMIYAGYKGGDIVEKVLNYNIS